MVLTYRTLLTHMVWESFCQIPREAAGELQHLRRHLTLVQPIEWATMQSLSEIVQQWKSGLSSMSLTSSVQLSCRQELESCCWNMMASGAGYNRWCGQQSRASSIENRLEFSVACAEYLLELSWLISVSE
jgi:hypothetical protein